MKYPSSRHTTNTTTTTTTDDDDVEYEVYDVVAETTRTTTLTTDNARANVLQVSNEKVKNLFCMLQNTPKK